MVVNRRSTFFSVLLITFVAGSLGAFVVEKNSLKVTAPASVAGTYESAIANFGTPRYGGSLTGAVVYPKDNPDACKGFGDKHQFSSGPGGLPIVVLVDRGGCYFTQKVWDTELAGASAVIVADDRDEPLITMDAPEDDPASSQYLDNITIPSALVTKSLGDKLKGILLSPSPDMVQIVLDWTEALPHPDERVEWEFWTNSNDECGEKCDVQAEFVKDFKGIAQTMEQAGYTQFNPHYITWYCPQAYIESKQCKSQCINNGRYCAPDPEQDFEIGYDGKDVVVENLRQLCVFQQAKEAGRPWLWWDYVSDFQLRCPMKDKLYNQECAETVINALGLDVRRIRDCLGDPNADRENVLLKTEQQAQVGEGDRGDVTILPTVVINQKQYRGKLDKASVLKALCSGFQESTEPPACLGQDVETNECLANNGGCWAGYNYTACKDTFRGRLCVCPITPEVSFVGDGYTTCEPSGIGRCKVNNGNCWQMDADGQHFSACDDTLPGTQCKCPPGFQGDGKTCTDIDECAPNSGVCKCPECQCKNTIGSFECTCKGDNLIYLHDHDTCIDSSGSGGAHVGLIVTLVVLGSAAVLAAGGYVVYKYRLRQYMDAEIRAIMAQYMPLDSQNENSQLQTEGP